MLTLESGRVHADYAWVQAFPNRSKAGRSAEQRYEALARAWRDRVIGRHTYVIVMASWALAAIFVIGLHLPSRPALFAGMLLGATIVFWWLLPEALMPGWISNWQFGAWGEQATAKELRKLPTNWAVRHDVASIGVTNRDHVVAGGSVFLLDTKSLSDSVVTVEGQALRVQAIEDPDKSYLLDRFPVGRSAYWLERDAESELGFPVAIYPVVVVWGRFEQETMWIGKMAVVRGDLIAQWLESRPADILHKERRDAIASWVRNLRHAD